MNWVILNLCGGEGAFEPWASLGLLPPLRILADRLWHKDAVWGRSHHKSLMDDPRIPRFSGLDRLVQHCFFYKIDLSICEKRWSLPWYISGHAGWQCRRGYQSVPDILAQTQTCRQSAARRASRWLEGAARGLFLQMDDAARVLKTDLGRHDARQTCQRAERGDRADFVRFGGKRRDHSIPRMRLDLKTVALIGKRPSQQKARGCQGAFGVLVKIDQPCEQHRKGLRLSIGALGAVDKSGRAIAQGDAGVGGAVHHA